MTDKAIRGEKDRERRLEPCKKCDRKFRNYWELAIHTRQGTVENFTCKFTKVKKMNNLMSGDFPQLTRKSVKFEIWRRKLINTLHF